MLAYIMSENKKTSHRILRGAIGKTKPDLLCIHSCSGTFCSLSFAARRIISPTVA